MISHLANTPMKSSDRKICIRIINFALETYQILIRMLARASKGGIGIQYYKVEKLDGKIIHKKWNEEEK